jgi:hypothetical protein
MIIYIKYGIPAFLKGFLMVCRGIYITGRCPISLGNHQIHNYLLSIIFNGLQWYDHKYSLILWRKY